MWQVATEAFSILKRSPPCHMYSRQSIPPHCSCRRWKTYKSWGQSTMFWTQLAVMRTTLAAPSIAYGICCYQYDMHAGSDLEG